MNGGDIKVIAPDGEIYDCDANYVYTTEPEPPESIDDDEPLEGRLAEAEDMLCDARNAGSGDGKAGPGKIEELEEEIKDLKAQARPAQMMPTKRAAAASCTTAPATTSC